MVQCNDATLYTGWTYNLAQRFSAHSQGRGARYTASRRPLRLLAFWHVKDRSTALKSECAFKGLTRQQKLARLAGTKVLGYRLCKPPFISPSEESVYMPTLHPPTPEEIIERTAEAKNHLVRLETPKGIIDLKLFPEDAPQHVASFLQLIHQGFYAGTCFHRVEPNFVIQGGCPRGDGTGGPGYTLPAEFNSRPHIKGTLAMARTSDPNSAGSQFYICLDTVSFLDGQYTVFGETVAGMDILDKIKRGDAIDSISVIPE